jgi:hypothetical protein
MAAAKKTPTNRQLDWQGMNWIRQEKRLAIYLRDGMACVWCGSSVEDGASLTLDHVVPDSKGGTNDAPNLVTSCHRCNSSRGNRSVPRFAKAVAAYLNHGVNPAEIVAHVHRTRARVLPKSEAKALIGRRGSVARVLAGWR